MTDVADKGEAAANQGAALLLIDFINAMDFDGAETMRDSALGAARAVARLRAAADAAKIPVVYVNDNYGRWHSERSRIVEEVSARSGTAAELARLLAPRHDDYFVIKPQFSGFYATNLPVLLPKLGARRLVMTGIAADICVLFTAADAHMRDYDLWVPADCVAGERPDHVEWALQIMQKSMGAETRPSSEVALADWVRGNLRAAARSR